MCDIICDRREVGREPIKKDLKQIDSNTWLVGNLLIRRTERGSPGHRAGDTTWIDEEDGSSYSLQETDPALHSAEAANSPYISLVEETPAVSGIWIIGSNVICKARYIHQGATPESDTLAFVQRQRPSFETPKVISHNFYNDRSYLFLGRLPGRTLDAAWPTLSTEWRDRYVTLAVKMIEEMAEWKGTKIGGFDGRPVPEWYLHKPGHGQRELDSAALEQTCASVGMDCSDLVFQHCDFGPTNLIVEKEPRLGSVGVIDWEAAGYFPRDWVRTNCHVKSGMDLTCWEPSYRWRAELGRVLGSHGFKELAQVWMDSRRS